MLCSILTVILPACSVGSTVNSQLGWNDNLAATFEAKLTFNRPSSSVLFYCIFIGAVCDGRSDVMVYKLINYENEQIATENDTKTVYNIGAVDTIFLGVYRHLMFLFILKKKCYGL